MDRGNFHPARMIFIDDKVENLLSVEVEMQKRNILTKGFYYTGAQKITSYEFEYEDKLVKELGISCFRFIMNELSVFLMKDKFLVYKEFRP